MNPTSRSELVNANLNGVQHGYDYDNIGNRRQAIEGSNYSQYTANNLNQYTDIYGSVNGQEFDFTPTFDDAGNQTLVKTSTGIWAVEYDAENRPISFTNAESATVVECTYDYMGRRGSKKVSVNGSVTLLLPDEEIFLYPVVIIGTNTNGHYIGEAEIKDFYSVVNKINERKKDCKQCYLVQVLMRKAAAAHHVMQPGCDIIYIIGHGTHRKGEDYIELADGLFRISRIQKTCFPIGCYVGDNRGRKTSQVSAIKLLTDKLRKYITIPDCPGKIICVFSGPLYPRRNS